ncbi:MAG: cation:proton antiporter family protein, partial [Actinomycetota bacterium]|nr:cation:proton antiporter family protein [Actinomycetota bacterium]
FVLHAFGLESTAGIEALAEIGVYLLLFGIGLKLNVGILARSAVWGTATIHMLITVVIVAGVLLTVGAIGLHLVTDLDLGHAAILGFAFSFSSTVLAVKLLEEMNESGSLAGRTAVGVLIVQDVFAVGFLAFSAGELPTVWAIPMILIVVSLRPAFGWLVSRSGHGELFVLLGFMIAVGIGAGGFGLVGMKPELGALLAGVAVSTHPRAGEMADRLLDFKDLFLVGFFLSIGLAGSPPPVAYLIAVMMVMLIPLKGALFFVLFTRFRLRARTALHSSLTLSSYSEFGLIVASASVAAGYLDQQWVSTIAVSVAVSFVVASAGNAVRFRLYGSYSHRLARLERHPPLSDDAIVDCAYARVVVFGMGRVGAGAYDEIVDRWSVPVVGVDRGERAVAFHADHGRTVIRGDALDRDFWERLRFRNDVELIVIATDNHSSNLECVNRAKEFLPEARIAAIARYPDQVVELRDAGVDVARNLYEEAGQGLADDAVITVWGSEPGVKESGNADGSDESADLNPPSGDR